MRMQPGKLFLGGAFIVLGVILLQATDVPRNVLFTSPDEMQTMTYPKILIWGWLAVSVLYLFLPASEETDWAGLKRCAPGVAQVALSIAVYALMFTSLGLALSTFLFLLLFFFVMGYRNPRLALPVAALGAGVTWLVFEKLLGVPMPYPVWLQFFY